MILPLTAAAHRHLLALVAHYERLGRPEAIRNLIAVLERASQRIPSGRGLSYAAPRPYPALAPLGLRWTKEGRYWIAYDAASGGPVIAAIFHDSANIPGRV